MKILVQPGNLNEIECENFSKFFYNLLLAIFLIDSLDQIHDENVNLKEWLLNMKQHHQHQVL